MTVLATSAARADAAATVIANAVDLPGHGASEPVPAAVPWRGMAAWLALCAGSLDAHAGPPRPPEGAAAAQLARGEDIYFASCAMCHNDDLSGGAAHSAPALTGEGFLGRWSGRSALDLLEVVRTTMPEGQPGSLDERGYLDVIAFVLMRNGIALGDAALTQQSVKQISMR